MGHVFSRITLAAGLAAALTLPAAAATTWQIDPAHSAAQFAVKHLAFPSNATRNLLVACVPTP